jgi:hypothetical protein
MKAIRQIILAAALLACPAEADPYAQMPQVPPPEKKVADYTAQDIVGCAFGQNMEQPKEHPLRVKDPTSKLKAEWPGAKVAANLDIILGYILLAETHKDDDIIGNGIYWILFCIMDVPKTEIGAAFARVYAAQPDQAKKRKVAYLGRLLFPWLADERILAPLRDMLDDQTLYRIRKFGDAGIKEYITVRNVAYHAVSGAIYDHDLLSVGLPEGQYLMDATQLDTLEISDDKSNEAASCAALKTWVNAHWAEITAKCAEARALPDDERDYPGPNELRILTPLTPEPNR